MRALSRHAIPDNIAGLDKGAIADRGAELLAGTRWAAIPVSAAAPPDEKTAKSLEVAPASLVASSNRRGSSRASHPRGNRRGYRSENQSR